MIQSRTWYRAVGCAVLLCSTLLAGMALAQESSELISLINAYRGSPQTCEGKRTVPAPALRLDPVLARVRVAAGAQLQDMLADAGYQAARAQTIAVSGPTDP